ncbi:hypothetical protein G6O69_34800 [Pseudenhygromyxa sp. WMMC2535]|uniref:hypothetical protein n=1 Tax=Pseudenhygromyxa sp. WMMC2535 TaxID=2712867 RepID=UPI00155439CD|nr:hypothetical protein [Pseudenhygromyxa sp. WMMC2535]NVB43044.1 hypothetical protein [Pseudenhygromyxa sp. WMMC2535]
MQRLSTISISAFSLLTLACSGDRGSDTSESTGIFTDTAADDQDTSADEVGSSDDDQGTGPLLDMGSEGTGTGSADDGGDDGECTQADWPDMDATLSGTVYAPNMELPISGALVYLTDEVVEGVPDGVYCAECVELDCDVPFVLTEADGSFSLPAVSGSGQQLVIQKGQFLRVVDIVVDPGSNAVAVDQSNLPGEWNPGAGMWIPRIGVYETYPDAVYNVLAKFGMGEVDASGQLVAGTEQFTMISDTDQGASLDDLDYMSQFHIMFVPCATTKYWDIAPTVPEARAQNIRDYVEAGGKWYATDHSNEYIEEPFPNYQEFYNPDAPDIQPAYESIAIVQDAELLAWLEALPPALKDIGGGNPTLNMLPAITTRLNYSGINEIAEVLVENDEGELVDVGHQAWVSGPCGSCDDANVMRPMAISGEYGCGRMMYSTFETSSVAHQGLNPQELVLLYMILEIGVCFGDPPPPPPPIG